MSLLETIGETVGWAFLGFIILYIAIRLFDLITPTDYRGEIRQGNIAAGIFVAAFIMSLTAIIVSVIVT
ncbi:MAG: DUF350 domain-containing protein [Cyanobacteria bacterium SW_9_44_58]|nr:MAG: DUF350 domain-containing protein [Cyanobacteria bacterium SW_9_44_58]